MGPFDEFYCARVAVFHYGNMLAAQEITQETYDFLTIFPKNRLGAVFKDLKLNFNQQMKNPLLYTFFEGKTIKLFIMETSPEDTKEFKMNFRSGLNILLGY